MVWSAAIRIKGYAEWGESDLMVWSAALRINGYAEWRQLRLKMKVNGMYK